jgi:hypothetical protein
MASETMGMKYYDPAVWHRDTWKFRRAEREFQIEIAQHALTEELEDEARFRQFSRMVSLAAEAAQAPRDEPSEEGFEVGFVALYFSASRRL